MSCFVDSCMVVLSLWLSIWLLTYYIAAICYICVFYRHFFWVYLDYSLTCFGLSSCPFFRFLFRALAKITGHVCFVGNKYFCSDLVSGNTLTTRRCTYEKGAKGEAECQAQSSLPPDLTRYPDAKHVSESWIQATKGKYITSTQIKVS